MEVQAPPGTTVGFVKQDWHPFLPKFSIQGADGQTLLRLEGPCFACNCCGDVNFEDFMFFEKVGEANQRSSVFS
ncbi:Phospholipid scramblase 3 [Goodea atripinnis]|uniref:Phospholipid scramblase n=1 Tax=Goodea atripinnis TaxID=208336 RepID=A0ABV0NZ65_9TELE